MRSFKVSTKPGQGLEADMDGGPFGALWEMCSPYFNPDYAEMVGKEMKEASYINSWEKLESVRESRLH